MQRFTGYNARSTSERQAPPSHGAPALRPGTAPHTQGASYTPNAQATGSPELIQNLCLPVPGRNRLRWYRILDRCPGAVLLQHRRSGTYRLVTDRYIADHLAGYAVHQNPGTGRQGPGRDSGPAREALDGLSTDTLRGAG